MKMKDMVVPFLFLASACSGGDPVDIGDDPEEKVVRTGEKLGDYAATWDGYVEAHQFASGSDRIRITLDENGQGTILLGDAEPPPPATDPDAFYPDPNAQLSTGPNLAAFEGFAYTAVGALVESKRLRLGLNSAELYRGWCELQSSYYDEEQDSYNCVPGGNGAGYDNGVCYIGETDDDPERIDVPCAHVTMCFGGYVCDCSESGCTVTNPSSYRECNYALDAALEDEGETLDGTLTGIGRVRMTRQ